MLREELKELCSAAPVFEVKVLEKKIKTVLTSIREQARERASQGKHYLVANVDISKQFQSQLLYVAETLDSILTEEDGLYVCYSIKNSTITLFVNWLDSVISECLLKIHSGRPLEIDVTEYSSGTDSLLKVLPDIVVDYDKNISIVKSGTNE